ncbi:hypothetical protein PTSG_02708 [Salpingoeca rosetta]|uniref:Dystroglycan-type cadherin-like domain-containing protein n=1 Tax=Salpingoeca rosetta (strain ATCC 50818 / BSB-021) TaxID=946362 RepID=F2U329_SALR5|nr:uncharacterized protein PTSG_02708 [Salpingoeca rosetta]EGD82023.1 hypothetical protein PTSG_02708 [Salpingoeca rosetta]|eukprot:XP_004996206.1 hypothetical protein PTSG_02708 [Salpingoeca rosetta]
MMMGVAPVIACCLVLSLLALGAVAQDVDVTVYPGRLFRADLSLQFGAAASVEAIATLTGNPAPPAWLRVNLLPIIYGQVPDDIAGDRFSAAILLRINDQPVTRTLNLMVDRTQGLPRVAFEVHATNANETQLVGDRYDDLETAVGITRARLSADTGQVGSGVLFVRSVAPFETDRRNINPMTSNPPLPVNNAYINGTAWLTLGSKLSDSQLTCAELEATAGSLFAAQGLQLDFDLCTPFPISTNATIDRSRVLATVEMRTWARTKDDFNETIIPASVIAAFIFFPFALIFIIHYFARSSDEAIEQQMHRLVKNMLRRNRAHTLRVISDDNTIAAAWLANSEEEEVVPPRLSTVSKPSNTSLPTSEHSRNLRYRTHTRPPTYRPPPQHDF